MKITETAFATQVESLFRLSQWRFFHIKPAIMRSGKWASNMNPEGKGFPDYCAVHTEKRRLIFAELKDKYSKPTSEQEEWLDALRECVRNISVTPVILAGQKILTGEVNAIIPSFEVYLWRPEQINEIQEILR